MCMWMSTDCISFVACLLFAWLCCNLALLRLPLVPSCHCNHFLASTDTHTVNVSMDMGAVVRIHKPFFGGQTQSLASFISLSISPALSIVKIISKITHVQHLFSFCNVACSLELAASVLIDLKVDVPLLLRIFSVYVLSLSSYQLYVCVCVCCLYMRASGTFGQRRSREGGREREREERKQVLVLYVILGLTDPFVQIQANVFLIPPGPEEWWTSNTHTHTKLYCKVN